MVSNTAVDMSASALPTSTPPSTLAAFSSAKDDRLPVTILSGFLGSGKTTLLEHILKNKDHGLRCAVIVNDMGQVNIDAALLGQHGAVQTKETIVQMENGCICCTLRGDLLEEVARLAEAKQFDYLIIESTGISEPQQVAETFAPEFADMHVQAAADLRAEAARVKEEAGRRKADDSTMQEDEPAVDLEGTLRIAQILGEGGLPKIARLDTCVTMVDAVSCLDNLATADFLSDRQAPGTVDEQDERNISDLLVDQLEFADVVIINKCDLVPRETIARLKSLVESLNPDAAILTSVRSQIDLTKVLNTGRFSVEKSIMSAGWLKSLREEIKPETEEYGIGSFVYKARRPFHPLRLWETICHSLVVIQDSYEAAPESMQGDGDGGTDGMSSVSGDSWENEPDPDAQSQLDAVARLSAKNADPAFGPLLRSKGFFWLATRPVMSGEWSQAGVMLTLGGGSRWLCETDEERWPDHPEVRAKMKADCQGLWGDRRQEIVFIGETIQTIRPLLTAELDAALLTDQEWTTWQRVMKSEKSMQKKIAQLDQLFDDGFEDWLDEEDPEVAKALHAAHVH